MKKVRLFLVIVNVSIVLATLLAFASPNIHPATSVIPGILGLAFPLLLIANVLLVILWASLKSYVGLLSLAVMILGWNHITAFINISPGPPEVEKIVRVGTLNCHHLIELSADRKPSKEKVVDMFATMNSPDILCVQEWSRAEAYYKAVDYPHFLRLPGTSNAIYSKYEIIEYQSIEVPGQKSLSAWIDLNIEGQTIRIFALYLASNQITEDSEKLMEEGTFQDTETWKEATTLAKRYAIASRIRAKQAEAIRTEIDKSPHPVLVCGDFNDVPLSYSVSTVRGDFQDSFVKCGNGIGTTYAGKLPGLRIDYILADENFEIISHRIPRINASDHHPVIAEVRIADL